MFVSERLVPGYFDRVADDVQLVERQPVVHVVILAAPAPVLVTEAVHHLKLGAAHRRHAAEILSVHQSAGLARKYGETRG